MSKASKKTSLPNAFLRYPFFKKSFKLQVLILGEVTKIFHDATVSKVSCYLQSSDILFVLCYKSNKNLCQNEYIKNTSSTEIKNIIIQFCKSLSKLCYY